MKRLAVLLLTAILLLTLLPSAALAENKFYFDKTNSTVFEGEISADAEISVPYAKLWSPESPFLYDLYITVKKDGEELDSVKSYFGMTSSRTNVLQELQGRVLWFC